MQRTVLHTRMQAHHTTLGLHHIPALQCVEHCHLNNEQLCVDLTWWQRRQLNVQVLSVLPDRLQGQQLVCAWTLAGILHVRTQQPHYFCALSTFANKRPSD